MTPILSVGKVGASRNETSYVLAPPHQLTRWENGARADNQRHTPGSSQATAPGPPACSQL